MATVITTSMTLRIILSVRGPLEYGGTFSTGSSHTASTRTTHVLSSRSGSGPNNLVPAAHTYTLDDIRSKREGEWAERSERDAKGLISIDPPEIATSDEGNVGVKITVDKEIGYDMYGHAR